MTFLFCLNVVLLITLWFVCRHGLINVESRSTLQLPAIVALLGVGTASFHLLAPWFLASLDAVPAIPHAALLLAGALMIAGALVLALASTRQTGSTASERAAWIVALLGCAYLSFAAIDHLVFCRDDGRAGYVDASLAQQAGIDCRAGFVLVRLSPDVGTATYRCPHNIVLGETPNAPFVPWPTYREDDSVDLARVLRSVGMSPSASR